MLNPPFSGLCPKNPKPTCSSRARGSWSSCGLRGGRRTTPTTGWRSHCPPGRPGGPNSQADPSCHCPLLHLMAS